MSDVLCFVCNEPWDSYGARHGDMIPWEYDLFRKGAGCPCCEGESQTNADDKAYNAAKQAVFDSTDDDELVDNFVHAIGKRPKWERPENPVLWECESCRCKVVENLDLPIEGGFELEWEFHKNVHWRVQNSYDDPTENPPHQIEGDAYCEVCVSLCSDCGDTAVFNDGGPDLYGPGGSIPTPGQGYYTNHRTCMDCYEQYYAHCDVCEESCSVDEMVEVSNPRKYQKWENDTLYVCETCKDDYPSTEENDD